MPRAPKRVPARRHDRRDMMVKLDGMPESPVFRALEDHGTTIV
jgi:hypothetical protein